MSYYTVSTAKTAVLYTIFRETREGESTIRFHSTVDFEIFVIYEFY